MRRLGVVVLVVCLTGLAPPARAQAGPAAKPVVYAHRGGAGYAPENTMGAFRKTESLFANRGVWLEMDTQATKDGMLVIIHDDSVDRTTNCSGKVNALTYAQIAKCNAAAHFAGWPSVERVPTLAQVLHNARIYGWKLMVEIKDIPGEANFDATGAKVAEQLVKTVYAENFPVDHLIIQSFWPGAIDNIRRLDKRIARLLLTTSSLGIPALGNTAYTTLGKHTITAPDTTSLGFNRQFVALTHRLGRQVVPWTVDDAAQMRTLRDWRVDGIITNRPDVAFATYR